MRSNKTEEAPTIACPVEDLSLGLSEPAVKRRLPPEPHIFCVGALHMSVVIKRVCAVLAAACVIAIAAGENANAQNPPARGMRWAKSAPFPEPEEELYGTVVNGKFYVIGGFGFNVPGATPPAAAGRGAAPATNAGPC